MTAWRWRWPAAAAAALAASAAAGQTPAANLSPPAEKYAVAPGGVDMRSGRYAYSQTDVDIGGEGGGLAVTRTLTQAVVGHSNPFGNFSHNWDILLTEKRVNIHLGNFRNGTGSDYQIEIGFGGLSRTFRSNSTAGSGFDHISRSGYAQLTFTGDKAGADVIYTYRSGDGTEAVFRPVGTAANAECSSVLRCAYVSQVTQADGTRLSFEYDNLGSRNTTRLRNVTSSRGYALVLEYSGTVVVKTCVLNLAVTVKPANNICPAGVPTATYAYSGSKLASATDASGATWGFTYAGANMSFLRPDETQPWLTNLIQERENDDGLIEEIVDQQSFADGSFYSYAFGESPFVEGHASQIAGGSFTNALGEATSLAYDFPVAPHSTQNACVHNGCPFYYVEDTPQYTNAYQITPGPVAVTDPLGRTTSYNYCDANAMANLPAGEINRCVVTPMPISTTDPEGIVTNMTWDFYTGNLLQMVQVPKSGSTLSNIQRSAAYTCTSTVFRYCTKPTSVTDGRGNTTDFTYSADHGGVVTETGAAPSAGAPRPQTRHEYAQRYAWIANGSGGWTQAAAPIWVRTATSLCRTGAATGNSASPCATAGDEVRTTYDYGPDSGPNNLLLRGQAVSATDGGVTTTLRTCFTYDSRGNRLSETRPNANLGSCPAALTGPAPFASAQRYDAMGRVTGTISADPDGAGGYPFLAVRNSYDPAGRLTRVETGTLAAWQSEAVAPAAWGASFTPNRTLETQYDMMSRKTRESVRDGAAGTVRTLTQYSYDAVGRLECTAVRMNPDTFGSLPASACTPATAGAHGPDRIARNAYDAAGQRLQLREGVGTAVEAAEATWAYNLNGQVTAVIDGNGNRATLRYDGHGRQDRWTFPSTTRPSAYNDATPATALATAGSVNAGDYEGYEYDANGNRTNLRKRDTRNIAFAYDALGRVTSKTYPDGGATPVHYGYDLRNLQLSARFNGPTGDGVVNQYDGFGRRTVEWQVMGGVTRYIASQYDADSNRIRITHPDGTEFTAGYDGLDRPYSLWTGWGAILGWMPRFDHGAPGSIGRGNGPIPGIATTRSSASRSPRIITRPRATTRCGPTATIPQASSPRSDATMRPTPGPRTTPSAATTPPTGSTATTGWARPVSRPSSSTTTTAT
jgi:YD repeat-containing protein